MKENWHNKELKDKIMDYDSPMDLEAAWASLDATRNSKKKKRPFLFWWTVGGVCLIAVVGLLLGVGGESVEPSSLVASQSLQSSQIENVNEINASKVEGNSKVNDKAISVDYSEQKVVDGKEIARSTTSSFFELNNDSKDVEVKRQNIIITSLENANKPAVVETSIPINGLKVVGSNLKGSNNKSSSLDFRKDSKLISSKANLNTFNLQKLDFYQFNDSNTYSLNQEVVFPDERGKEYGKKKRRKQSHIGISASYGYFTSGGLIREESNLDAFAFDLFYDRFLTKTIYFRTGLSFYQFTNELNASKARNYTQMVDNQLTRVDVLLDGTEVKEYSTAEVYFTETNTFQAYNRYRFVSIPLVLGKEFSLTEGSNIQVEGGMACSIFSKQSGKVFHENNIQDIEDLSDSSFRNVGILQAVYGVSYQFRITDNSSWNFFTGLQGNFQLNKFAKSEGLNVKKLSAQEVVFGLRFSL